MWCAVPAALCDAGAVVAFVCVHVRSHVGVLSTDRPLLRRLRVCAGHWRCTGKHGGGVTSSGVAGVRGWAVRVRRWRCAAVVAPGRGGRWFPAAGAGTTRAVCAADAPPRWLRQLHGVVRRLETGAGRSVCAQCFFPCVARWVRLRGARARTRLRRCGDCLVLWCAQEATDALCGTTEPTQRRAGGVYCAVCCV